MDMTFSHSCGGRTWYEHERTSRRVLLLTWVLVVLTVVLAWLTFELWHAETSSPHNAAAPAETTG